MGPLLVLAFLVVPLLEIYVIVQVGQAVGAWPTIGLLLLMSLFGAWIVRREGRRAWVALRAALSAGRMPSRELADGALVLIGGTLLLTPGFLTDAAGFLLVLPPTRAVMRRALLAWVARRATVVTGAWVSGLGQRGPTTRRDRPGPVVQGDVVEGEVVGDGEPDGRGPSR